MTDRTRVASYGPHEEVLVDRIVGDDGIYVVSLNDPETFNTMTVALMKAIAEAFDAISERADPDPNKDEVRAVVLRGEGRGFAIGLDIGKLDEYFSGGISGKTDPWRAIWDCPFPVIGAVNGPAVTGGFEIALGCDVLLASPRAVFMDNHAKYGVHPGRRLSQRLMHVCGVNNAKFATMSSFPIEADVARTWGLVQQVYPDNNALERASIELARMMARNHPMMVKRYKSLIDGGVMGTYADGLALEAASDSTYYDDLTDMKATLEDGAAKFQELVSWVAARE
ncbi:MAG: enoyl-CoA hydratase-related protein [Proteobacteria bacterium]|nr:enoyl-CoA hydratase-related protein [Pseudomonadota bacterium]